MENRYLNIQSSDCLSARAEIAIGCSIDKNCMHEERME